MIVLRFAFCLYFFFLVGGMFLSIWWMEQLTFTKIDRFSESLGLVSEVDYGQG